MKFSINDFFCKCEETADLVTFTEEILNGKLNSFVQYDINQDESYTRISNKQKVYFFTRVKPNETHLRCLS